MTGSDSHPIRYFVCASRTGIVLPRDTEGKGLSDLPQGARLICGGAGTQSQRCLTQVSFYHSRCPCSCSGFVPNHPSSLGLSHGSPHLPPTAASSQEAWGLQLSHQLGREVQMPGLKEEKKKDGQVSSVRSSYCPCLSAKLSGTQGWVQPVHGSPGHPEREQNHQGQGKDRQFLLATP